MKKTTRLLAILLGIIALTTACNDAETFEDKKNRHNAAISQYLADSKVNIISETQFAQQNYTTDVNKNEWVLFGSNGLYMQVVRKGCGEKLKQGETATVLCRYSERNLMTNNYEASNILVSDYQKVNIDKMEVTNSSGSFEASFVSSTLVTQHSLSSTSVPEAWLVPLAYINLGRPANDGDEIAKVLLIVPYEIGHSVAMSSVIPYLYDITYERGR